MATSNDLLSFKEWYSKNPSIPYANRVQKYNDYLKGVMVDQVIVADDIQRNEVSNNYKAFLSKLVNIYGDDPDVVKLVDLDLDDPHQLALAIPIFTTKIRDIALFYTKKRRTLGDLKMELSLKGTSLGIEKCITDLFYDKVSLIKCVPTKPEMVENLDIVIVEKYNTTSQHPNSNN